MFTYNRCDRRYLRRNRSDGRLKRNLSSEDGRIWSQGVHDRNNYIRDYISSSYESHHGRYVPVPVLVDLLLGDLRSTFQDDIDILKDGEPQQKRKKDVTPSSFDIEENDRNVAMDREPWGVIIEGEGTIPRKPTAPSQESDDKLSIEMHMASEGDDMKRKPSLIMPQDEIPMGDGLKIKLMNEIDADFDKLIASKKKAVTKSTKVSSQKVSQKNKEKVKSALISCCTDLEFFKKLKELEDDAERKEKEVQNLVETLKAQVMEIENVRNKISSKRQTNELEAKEILRKEKRTICEEKRAKDEISKEEEGPEGQEYNKIKEEVECLSQRVSVIEQMSVGMKEEENMGEMKDIEEGCLKTIEELKQKIQVLEEEKDNDKNSNEELSRKLEGLGDQNERVKELQEKLKCCEADKERLEEKVTALENQMKQEKEGIEKSEESVKDKSEDESETIARLKKQISSLESDLEKANTQLDSKSKIIDLLNEKMAVTDMTLSDQDKDFSDLKEKYAKLVSECQELKIKQLKYEEQEGVRADENLLQLNKVFPPESEMKKDQILKELEKEKITPDITVEDDTKKITKEKELIPMKIMEGKVSSEVKPVIQPEKEQAELETKKAEELDKSKTIVDTTLKEKILVDIAKEKDKEQKLKTIDESIDESEVKEIPGPMEKSLGKSTEEKEPKTKEIRPTQKEDKAAIEVREPEKKKLEPKPEKERTIEEEKEKSSKQLKETEEFTDKPVQKIDVKDIKTDKLEEDKVVIEVKDPEQKKLEPRPEKESTIEDKQEKSPTQPKETEEFTDKPVQTIEIAQVPAVESKKEMITSESGKEQVPSKESTEKVKPVQKINVKDIKTDKLEEDKVVIEVKDPEQKKLEPKPEKESTIEDKQEKSPTQPKETEEFTDKPVQTIEIAQVPAVESKKEMITSESGKEQVPSKESTEKVKPVQKINVKDIKTDKLEEDKVVIEVKDPEQKKLEPKPEKESTIEDKQEKSPTQPKETEEFTDKPVQTIEIAQVPAVESKKEMITSESGKEQVPSKESTEKVKPVQKIDVKDIKTDKLEEEKASKTERDRNEEEKKADIKKDVAPMKGDKKLIELDKDKTQTKVKEADKLKEEKLPKKAMEKAPEEKKLEKKAETVAPKTEKVKSTEEKKAITKKEESAPEGDEALIKVKQKIPEKPPVEKKSIGVEEIPETALDIAADDKELIVLWSKEGEIPSPESEMQFEKDRESLETKLSKDILKEPTKLKSESVDIPTKITMTNIEGTGVVSKPKISLDEREKPEEKKLKAISSLEEKEKVEQGIEKIELRQVTIGQLDLEKPAVTKTTTEREVKETAEKDMDVCKKFLKTKDLEQDKVIAEKDVGICKKFLTRKDQDKVTTIYRKEEKSGVCDYKQILKQLRSEVEHIKVPSPCRSDHLIMQPCERDTIRALVFYPARISEPEVIRNQTIKTISPVKKVSLTALVNIERLKKPHDVDDHLNEHHEEFCKCKDSQRNVSTFKSLEKQTTSVTQPSSSRSSKSRANSQTNISKYDFIKEVTTVTKVVQRKHSLTALINIQPDQH